MRPFSRTILFFFILSTLFACKVKSGCPSTGSNVGAEKIASGDPRAVKQLNKAGKYKLNKF
ncbi:MAG: hypothetical protein JWN76_518 [Chitinophagaceae bacterium]|nr:hypothetical protein [Chitinophagaceae bacterium]